MEKPKPGKSNLEVCAISLGCVGVTFGYGPRNDNQIHRPSG